jgi:hypothetical protein
MPGPTSTEAMPVAAEIATRADPGFCLTKRKINIWGTVKRGFI